MKHIAILLVLALLLAGCAAAPAQESTASSTTLPVQTEPMPSVSSEPASLPPESTAPEKETEYYIFIPEDDPGLTWLWGYLGIKLEDYPNPYLYAKNMDTREILLLLDKDSKMFRQNGKDVYCITEENELYRLRLDIPGSQTLLYTAQYGELGSLSPYMADQVFFEQLLGVCFLDGDHVLLLDSISNGVLQDEVCPGIRLVCGRTADSFYWEDEAGTEWIRDCTTGEDRLGSRFVEAKSLPQPWEDQNVYWVFLTEDTESTAWQWPHLGIDIRDYPEPYVYAKNLKTGEITLLLDTETASVVSFGFDAYCITKDGRVFYIPIREPEKARCIYTAQHGTLSSLTLSLDSPYLEKITGICFLDGDQAVGMDYPAGNVLFDVECPGAQWVWANTTDSFYWKNAAGERFLRDCLTGEDRPVAHIGEESTGEK